MSLNEFLLGSAIYLAAAVISAPIAKRLGLGSVLGFLAAGAIIGPSVLNLTGGQGEEVQHFAEFGVIVMLFLIGLELEPAKLWQLRKQIFGLGLLQVAGTAAVIGAASLFVSSGWRESLAIGLILALSSTAIVLQTMAEKGTLKTPVGQSVFSVLLFQDISVIPMLALLPLVGVAAAAGHGGEAHAASLIGAYPVWAQALLTIAAIALVLAGGRYLMRPLFRIVADTGTREIFVAFALLIVVGITLLMGLVGISPALGTFLAGVVLADSEYRHELEMDLNPFKGLLLAIFFIAVGSGIDFSLLFSAPLALGLGLVAYVALKLATHFSLARLFGMSGPDRSRFSFALAQGSEFGFVLITLCVGLSLLSGTMPALLTAIIALSMALSPLLMMLDEKVIQPRFADGDFLRDADVIEHDGVDAIIAGHGRFGMTVGRVLSAQGKRTVVLDIDSSQVDTLRAFGFKVFYGDALRVDLLESAGAREAKLLIIAIDDREKITELVRIAKQNFPHLKLLVRVFDRAHAYEVMAEGVQDIYREVYSASVDLARDALVSLGTHPYEAQRAVTKFRAIDEKFLRKSAAHANDRSKLIDLARQSRAEAARVFAADRGGETSDTDNSWFDEDGTRS
ncbi:MAG: monovalent cation:proton antiporter-2 (CPA2) family protein [Proteobacteria bacterium]|nr:monovalent cation:proton antiporter-2 (CPA2) family protein [Pseudomonadota bacterium]